MARLAIIGIVLALVAGGSSISAAQSLGARPALEYTTVGNAFARSVAARYAGIPAAEIRADLRAQEFVCVGDGSYCTRTVSDESCTNAWTVDIETDGAVGGRHAILCMGGEDE
jgi:hypothetical protein